MYLHHRMLLLHSHRAASFFLSLKRVNLFVTVYSTSPIAIPHLPFIALFLNHLSLHFCIFIFLFFLSSTLSFFCFLYAFPRFLLPMRSSVFTPLALTPRFRFFPTSIFYTCMNKRSPFLITFFDHRNVFIRIKPNRRSFHTCPS